MRALVHGEWADRYLDYWRAPGEVRVEVHLWVVLESLDEMYFVRPWTLRLLWDYGREVGPLQVARKVMSRLEERGRNSKFVACGIGRVIEPDTEAGRWVEFFAPCHPECVERIVVPVELTRPAAEPRGVAAITFVPRVDSDRFWHEWAAWQRESGTRPSSDEIMPAVSEFLRSRDWTAERRLSVGTPSPVSERAGDFAENPADTVTASLFGYGHYARSIVLPNLPDAIEIRTVHELDPLLSVDPSTQWDTCPWPREGEQFDLLIAAGFHASHAPLAVAALEKGAVALVEKPIATTRPALARLLEALRGNGGRFYAGFHKRYSPMNDLVREDLELDRREPLSYHCIVHEVSLPSRHWYRWPSAGGRILANGCHWLDHFLFLNDWAPVATADALRASNGEVMCTATLQNGASFSMTLTDRGSDRVGTREYVRIATENRTVTIEDAQSYRAEGPDRLIRSEKFHKLAAHCAMYGAIGNDIVYGGPGDSIVSVERSAELALALAEAAGSEF